MISDIQKEDGLNKNIKKRINKRNNNITRTCVSCNIEYPKNKENFNISNTTRDGVVFKVYCKKCEKIKGILHNSKLKPFINSLLQSTKRSKSKRRNDFINNITLDYLLELYKNQNGICPITNLKMTHVKGEGICLTNISLDRINNSLPYIEGNVQLVCLWANYAMNTTTPEEFKKFITLSYNKINNINTN